MHLLETNMQKVEVTELAAITVGLQTQWLSSAHWHFWAQTELLFHQEYPNPVDKPQNSYTQARQWWSAGLHRELITPARATLLPYGQCPVIVIRSITTSIEVFWWLYLEIFYAECTRILCVAKLIGFTVVTVNCLAKSCILPRKLKTNWNELWAITKTHISTKKCLALTTAPVTSPLTITTVSPSSENAPWYWTNKNLMV